MLYKAPRILPTPPLPMPPVHSPSHTAHLFLSLFLLQDSLGPSPSSGKAPHNSWLPQASGASHKSPAPISLQPWLPCLFGSLASPSPPELEHHCKSIAKTLASEPGAQRLAESGYSVPIELK